MLWRGHPIALLGLLVLGVFASSFYIKLVKASGTIYIRADGSIDPSDAPLSTLDNVTYTFAGNINDSIVVERNNIVVEGAGHTVTGSGSGNGITLTSGSNMTVRNMTIENFEYGIELSYSSNNTLSDNNVTANSAEGISLSSSSNNTLSGNNAANNEYGIYLVFSSSNILSGNNITNSGKGVELDSSSGNSIYHNNFINNAQQALVSEGYTNTWNESYPSGGNYWSDYTGTDANHDGIGDTPYVIDANNTDHYPLMVPYIIPEFPSFLILPLFFVATLLAVIVHRKKHAKISKSP